MTEKEFYERYQRLTEYNPELMKKYYILYVEMREKEKENSLPTSQFD